VRCRTENPGPRPHTALPGQLWRLVRELPVEKRDSPYQAFNFREVHIMNRKLTIAALFIGAMTLPVLGYSADTAKDAIKDSVITTKIKAEMVKDPVVSAMRIKVDTDDKGVVSLSGTAKSQAEVDKAVSIAQNTKGVSSVQNNIKIAQ